ncbi:hypothetical protein Pmani_030539 [Petrolisthes manimaculis]|uniref:Outer dense fiber protein 3 n=1 Tax=Petrolisthes manimaculis TaxID=1843537 RepID=A0AAE1TTH6_9EUCA|nr:hypothetical protein Pmani_030539 [Petrolisthes manimaculis]
MRSKMGGQSNGTWTPTKRRGPIAAEFTSPGPASIALRSSIGSGGATKSRPPAFTMTSRHEIKPDKAGPGPGQYNVTGLSNKAGKDEPVAASMHIRPKDPKVYITPAPCDYSPDKAEAKVNEASPCFSFGIKVENGKGSDAPAPNSYNIPTLLGSTKEGSKHSAPSFTMAARARDEEDKMKVPGPGSYDDSTVDKYKALKSPCFSMGQRTTIPSDHTMKPGPGAHCPEKYIESGPKFTMAKRLPEDTDKMKVPGPGTYESGDINNCREKLPAFTMAPKTTLPTDRSPKPAPNAYSPEKYNESGPMFTMAMRLPDDSDKMKVPGPGSYNAGDIDMCREKLPAYTMAPKTQLPTDRTPKPAPNAYSPEKYNESGPMFTMAMRLPDDSDKMKVPGPGSYNAGDIDMCREKLPAYTMAPKTTLPCDHTNKPAPNAYAPEKYVPAGPKFSLSARPVEERDRMNVPGPGSYEASNLDSCRNAQPAFSMAPKFTLPVDHTIKPAPNAYSPEKSESSEQANTPHFSFGIKHSKYLGQLRVQ